MSTTIADSTTRLNATINRTRKAILAARRDLSVGIARLEQINPDVDASRDQVIDAKRRLVRAMAPVAIAADVFATIFGETEIDGVFSKCLSELAELQNEQPTVRTVTLFGLRLLTITGHAQIEFPRWLPLMVEQQQPAKIEVVANPEFYAGREPAHIPAR